MHHTRRPREGERLFDNASGNSSPLTGGCATPARSRMRSQRVGWVERKRNPSPFAETGTFISRILCPIERIGAETDPAAKRGIWPIPHARRVTMFDRIEMDVVEMTREIVLVAQGVLPLPPMKNAPLASAGAAGGGAFASRQTV
jgi:hypothetical protein